jgi:tetratricopeptide (TPR) repeat protein
MRPTRHVTAVILLAAFGAVGCSKRAEAPPAKQRPTDAAETPAMPTGTTAVVTKSESEGRGPSVGLTIGGSFADGEVAFNARKYGEASAIYDGYVARQPKNVWGHYMLALSAWKNGDLDKSERAFEAALSIDPSHMKSLVNESRLFLDEKRYDDAIDRLTKASMVDPESSEVFRLLGRTYTAKGDTDEAIAAYQAAIEVNDADVWSMNNLGLLLIQARRADEAVPLLAKAVELRTDVAEFHNNLGMALEHTGRFTAAAKEYAEALAANAGYAKAKNNLARVQAIKSGPEEPFDLAQAAKSVQPPTKDSGVVSATTDEHVGTK